MAFTSSSVGAGVSIFAIPIKLAANPLGFTVELGFVWSDRTSTLIKRLNFKSVCVLHPIHKIPQQYFEDLRKSAMIGDIKNLNYSLATSH
jgi:hypothetical protein